MIHQPEAEHPYHRREFGVPILTPQTPALDVIDSRTVKVPTLKRSVPTATNNTFVSNSSGLLFNDNNPTTITPKFESTDSPTLFTNSNLVSNTTVSPTPLFATSHTNSPSMDGSVADMNLLNGAPATLNTASGTYFHFQQLANTTSELDLDMKKLFEEYVVGDFEEDPSLFFTPYTTADTSFTHSSVISGIDTPSFNLAQIDSLLNTTSFPNGDFDLYGDNVAANSKDWNQSPLFNPSLLAEDPVAPYAIFKTTSATVTSASPQQLSVPTIGDEPVVSKPFPSPENSPCTARKPTSTTRRPAATRPTPARRVSSAPTFTPITPAATTPSTPQPFVTRHTKRRIPIVGEDPSVVEKRRRNTIAAQRSRARKAEEKALDKSTIARLEKENESLRVLKSYWKERACELGASPCEDGEN